MAAVRIAARPQHKPWSAYPETPPNQASERSDWHAWSTIHGLPESRTECAFQKDQADCRRNKDQTRFHARRLSRVLTRAPMSSSLALAQPGWPVLSKLNARDSK